MFLYTVPRFQSGLEKNGDHYNSLIINYIFYLNQFFRHLAHALLYWVVKAPRMSKGPETITQLKKGGAQ